MSTALQVEVEAAALSRALARYRSETSKTTTEVLQRQGANLATFLRRRLTAIAPARGSIRRERLALLADAAGRSRGSTKGLGVHIRPRIRAKVLAKYGAASDSGTRQLTIQRGKNRLTYSQRLAFGKAVKGRAPKGTVKRLNLQSEMVKAELNLREQGIGFLGVSSRYPRRLQQKVAFARSKYGLFLSSLGINADGDTLTMHWDGSRSELQASAATGLGKPKASAAIALAMRDTYQDINKHLADRLKKNAAPLK